MTAAELWQPISQKLGDDGWEIESFFQVENLTFKRPKLSQFGAKIKINIQDHFWNLENKSFHLAPMYINGIFCFNNVAEIDI